MFRKLFMTSLITFIYPRSSSQIATGLAVSIWCLIHFLYLHPFLDRTIGHTQVAFAGSAATAACFLPDSPSRVCLHLSHSHQVCRPTRSPPSA
jgi:hypothetical protein